MLASFALAASLCIGTPPAAEGDVFPFFISYEAPSNVTNVSEWLDRPAGAHGFVRANGSRLVTDSGTNLCSDACFPEKRQAERLAQRLARFGINVVRMHHMDSRSIWGRSPNKLTIDPERLHRLDYLIYQLKQNGIYTNINLHVSRWFGPEEGFPHREKRPKYDKGLDNFEPRMIELQKKYAKDLLTHRNPYTGTRYVEEPAIAFVEISNEDALFNEWRRGSLNALPEPYATTFRRIWNEWLHKKYGTTAVLANAWARGEVPLGRELLKDTQFKQPLSQAWQVERDELTRFNWSVKGGGPQGLPYMELKVERTGEGRS